jgi:hypothetical protein
LVVPRSMPTARAMEVPFCRAVQVEWLPLIIVAPRPAVKQP